MFWRLNLYYRDRRFSAHHFANCPVPVVLGALEAIQGYRNDLGDTFSRATANLGVFLAPALGVKDAKTRYFNDFEAQRFYELAVRTVDPESAQVFLKLQQAGELPPWVAEHVDLDLIQASASSQKNAATN